MFYWFHNQYCLFIFGTKRNTTFIQLTMCDLRGRHKARHVCLLSQVSTARSSHGMYNLSTIMLTFVTYCLAFSSFLIVIEMERFIVYRFLLNIIQLV